MASTVTRIHRLTARAVTRLIEQPRVTRTRLSIPTAKHCIHTSSTSEEPSARFFDFYLEKLKIVPKGVQPGAWLETRDADVALEALEPGLRDRPLAAFNSPTCDLDLAGRCLEAYAVNVHAETETRAAARQRFISAKPGTRALHWLLQSGAYQTADLALEPRFTNFMIHCLAAENSDERVMTWLQTRHMPEHLALLPPKQATSWKGIMLMLLVEHRVFWSNNDMNFAFMPLLKAFLHNRGPPLQPLDGEIPLQQAVIWTLQQLRYSANETVDPKQYERFVALYKLLFSHTEPHLFELDLAHLSMFHPSMPDPNLAFQHITSWPEISEESSFHHRYLQPKTKAVAQYMLQFVVRTARMLADRGRITDARKALSTGRTSLPDLFQMKDIHATGKWIADKSFDRAQYTKNSWGMRSRKRLDAILTARQEQGNFW